jgi:putative endonuclease
MGIRSLVAQLREAYQRYQSLDRRGERAAERFVRRAGYKIVARRERSPLGELDLVAVDGRTVVFIEVKTRAAHTAGHPGEAVDLEKQKKLTRLALAYLKRHDLLEYPARFDVLAVTWPAKSRRPKIEHYKSAFEATGRNGLFS